MAGAFEQGEGLDGKEKRQGASGEREDDAKDEIKGAIKGVSHAGKYSIFSGLVPLHCGGNG